MRIVKAAWLGWLTLGAMACGRLGLPATITDRLEGEDDATVAEAEPSTQRSHVVYVAARASDAVPSPSRRRADAAAEGDVVVTEPQPGSHRLLELATVHASPDPQSPMLATIAAGTRVAVFGTAEGQGCEHPWLEVAPRGFLCAPTEASDAEPSTAMLPKLPRGAVVPGVYGKVSDSALIYASAGDAARGVGGSSSAKKLTVSRLGRERIGGRAFWRTSQGYVAEADVRRHRGSRFAGVRLDAEGAPALPLAWALARPGAERSSIAVHEAPRASSRVVDRLRSRTVVNVATIAKGWVQVEGGWIAAADVRVATRTETPEGLADGERWVDIDLEEQVLVAYEGDTPVYATMISSGRIGHRTPTGVFRVERKVAERTMNSMADSDEEYSVARVPWTAYFAKGYALHAAYWHDGFGNPRSHGCVNLAPRDAKELYAFLAPANAPGYTEIYGHEAQPGSVVRVRSRRDPNPEVQGYAKAMLDAAPTLVATRD